MPSVNETLPHSPLKVLLVEDDEDDALITRSLLDFASGPPMELDWVPSYEAGLIQFKQHHHDIGLIDYHLGLKNGIDLVREVHAEGHYPPIILLTGQGNESLVMEALHSGVIDYIPKRILSTENLQRAIVHGIEKAKLTAELEFRQRQLEMSNRELQKKNEEIRRFYHLLAHELKTPLTSAWEFVNILLEHIPGALNTSQEEYLTLIQNCCAHMDRNINDLYDISRLETGKLSFHLNANFLQPVVVDVLSCLSPRALSKNICVQSAVDPSLPQVLMDAQRIKQVLLNLVGNALKFTPSGGEVRVSAGMDRHCPGRIKVSVEDSGIGIPKDQLENIFERLFQVNENFTSSTPGLGLGLFICREIIKLHGGIMAASSMPEKGSTFSFTLPCELKMSKKNSDGREKPHG